ncbi:hypothetical protein NX059_000846 [Plenodomus lindquistii]|nr:hypothetical protein NX059_000846 [Plenodomus lindquistii]
MKTFIALVLAIVPTLALDLAHERRTSKKPAVVSFEEYDALPGAILPVGITPQGLKLISFVVAKNPENSIGGTKPQSPPNRASASFVSRVVDGVLVPNFANPLQPPAFTVDYEGSPFDLFDLESLYLSCLIPSVVPLVRIGTACRVRFEAIKPDGTLKATKVVQYEEKTANPLDVEEMDPVNFSDFTGLKEVHIFLEAGPTTINPPDEILTGILVDGIKIALHKS